MFDLPFAPLIDHSGTAPGRPRTPWAAAGRLIRKFRARSARTVTAATCLRQSPTAFAGTVQCWNGSVLERPGAGTAQRASRTGRNGHQSREHAGCITLKRDIRFVTG